MNLGLFLLEGLCAVSVVDELDEDDAGHESTRTEVYYQNQVASFLQRGENARQTTKKQKSARDGRQLASVTVLKVCHDLEHITQKRFQKGISGDKILESFEGTAIFRQMNQVREEGFLKRVPIASAEYGV